MRTALIHGLIVAAIALSVWPMSPSVAQGRPRPGERIAERLAQRRTTPVVDTALPAGVRVWKDQSYGGDPRQRYDVYAPADARNAPTLFLVHGGGWRRGDKAADNVVTAKVRHWTALGYVVISSNYRLLPEADPLTQARDVATAVATAQRDSGRWGGDAGHFVLMGHSAGAHLSALLAASPALLAQVDAQPIRGAVLLDSAMLDGESLLPAPHPRLYDEAFGSDPTYWRATSPYAQLSADGAPMLAVCSSLRRAACPQAHAFVARAHALGRRARVREEALSHADINARLGEPSAYTAAVDAFLREL